MQEDEEAANYSYNIPINELLDSVSDGEKEAVEQKPGLDSVPHQLDKPQEEVVNHEPGSSKVTRRMEGSPPKKTQSLEYFSYTGGGVLPAGHNAFSNIVFFKNHLDHSWTAKRMFH